VVPLCIAKADLLTSSKGIEFCSGTQWVKQDPKIFVTCLQETYEYSAKLTWYLTPWRRVLLEKLTVTQLVKKLPIFYGTWRFITMFTRARQFQGSV